MTDLDEPLTSFVEIVWVFSRENRGGVHSLSKTEGDGLATNPLGFDSTPYFCADLHFSGQLEIR